MVSDFLQRRGVPVVRHDGDVSYDLLAWGCVRIEVKSASPRPCSRDRVQYLFCFSADQRARAAADVVVLVTLDDLRMFWFAGDHPVFTWKKARGGRRKSAVAWTVPQARSYGTANEETYLSGELMRSHLDAFDVVETKRLLFSARLARRQVANESVG